MFGTKNYGKVAWTVPIIPTLFSILILIVTYLSHTNGILVFLFHKFTWLALNCAGIGIAWFFKNEKINLDNKIEEKEVVHNEKKLMMETLKILTNSLTGTIICNETLYKDINKIYA